jgi:hypothetical protein
MYKCINAGFLYMTAILSHNELYPTTVWATRPAYHAQPCWLQPCVRSWSYQIYAIRVSRLLKTQKPTYFTAILRGTQRSQYLFASESTSHPYSHWPSFSKRGTLKPQISAWLSLPRANLGPSKPPKTSSKRHRKRNAQGGSLVKPSTNWYTTAAVTSATTCLGWTWDENHRGDGKKHAWKMLKNTIYTCICMYVCIFNNYYHHYCYIILYIYIIILI